MLRALQTKGAAFALGADVRLPDYARVASGVFCDGQHYRLTSNASTALEFGEYGRPETAVSDVAIVNLCIGPVPYAGPQTGDGTRVHAGSTRIWLDNILYDGPFGDEAFSVLHYIGEDPKRAMAVTLSNCTWQNMSHANLGSNYGVLVNTGDAGYELGDWVNVLDRRPPTEVTLYRCKMTDVWWRCPLVYHGRLHYVESTVTRWNHPDGGGPACDLYGASEAIVERCTFDKAGSTTQAAAIQCNEQEGHMPRLTERDNTFVGSYPWGAVVRNGAEEARLPLPYSL